MDAGRLKRVRANLEGMGLSQLLVCDPWSISWLTGYFTEPFERFLGLLISTEADPVLFANRLFPDAGAYVDDVRVFSDTDDPTALVAGCLRRDASLGVDKELAARWLVPLMERGAASAYPLGSPALDAARAIKDEAERELMRRASATNDAAMDWLVAQVRDGVSERGIAEGLEAHYRELGAEGNSFIPIVSFGATASDPHHEPDSTVVSTGDVVLFDVGCRQDGYCSDMTRSFFWREVSDAHAAVYECVRAANEAAEAIVAPGVRFCDIDRAARAVIEEAGWGEYFTHRLGHQIGIQVHEPGDVSAAHDEPVQAGMCFSIEPGIYLPGDVGVRIEDLVIVTEDGCEVINRYPHELRVLGA